MACAVGFLLLLGVWFIVLRCLGVNGVSAQLQEQEQEIRRLRNALKLTEDNHRELKAPGMGELRKLLSTGTLRALGPPEQELEFMGYGEEDGKFGFVAES